MEVDVKNTANPRFQKFQELLAETLKDPAEAARFNAEVTDAASLTAYCAERGLTLRQSEADGIFEAAGELAKARLEALRQSGALNDVDLEAVSGGVSWAAVGGTLGAIVGVGLAVAAAPAVLTGALALQGAAIIGTAITSAGAGAFSGGVVGAGIGAVSEKVADLFRS